jgi:hypothetical protein
MVRLPPNTRLLNSSTKAIAHGGLSDHTPLLTTLAIENYGYYPAPEPHVAAAEPRIVTPISSKHLAFFKRCMTESFSMEIAEFYNITTNTAKAMRSAWEETHDYEAIKRHLAPNGMLAIPG